ncbi:MAG: hypothetical protein UZ17_ACD001002615 [Acidobacteria bacterium OLB17]|nr:MAG: hypothetical protein UZ17_ACD001002615 [Acidobacteria bacterium OLB17]
MRVQDLGHLAFEFQYHVQQYRLGVVPLDVGNDRVVELEVALGTSVVAVLLGRDDLQVGDDVEKVKLLLRFASRRVVVRVFPNNRVRAEADKRVRDRLDCPGSPLLREGLGQSPEREIDHVVVTLIPLVMLDQGVIGFLILSREGPFS